MKRLFILMIFLTAISLTAFAANRNSGTVTFTEPVKVGATELPAGSYNVTWTGPSESARVTMKQGKTTATTTAQVKEERNSQNSFEITEENGSRVLTELQFRDATLVLTPAVSQPAGR